MPHQPPLDIKAQALRTAGALNLHPERVRAPLFGSHDFFDARDWVQVKYEMLRCVQTEASPVSDATAAFGFSRPSYYKAAADYKRMGIAGLLPRRPGPKGPHKLTPEVMAFVRELLSAEAGLGLPELVRLVAARFNVQVHRRTIERALRQKGKKQRRTE